MTYLLSLFRRRSINTAALEAQIDAVFDEATARIKRLTAECPARKCRTGDQP